MYEFPFMNPFTFWFSHLHCWSEHPPPFTCHLYLSIKFEIWKFIRSIFCTVGIRHIHLFQHVFLTLSKTSSLSILGIISCSPWHFPTSSSSHWNSFLSLSMAYIRATGHSVPLMMQIAEGGYARVYASVLHARFGFHPTSIHIEEEVLSESGKVDRTILQLSLRDDEGQLWLLLPGRLGLSCGR
jgi:hypothetical protein